jgi:hypothetical protein
MAEGALTRWFVAGEPEGLAGDARDFAGLLADRLEALSPSGVERRETAVRAESGGGDLVVPHRLFRGLAVAARVAGGQVEIFWLRVRTPSDPTTLTSREAVVGRCSRRRITATAGSRRQSTGSQPN